MLRVDFAGDIFANVFVRRGSLYRCIVTVCIFFFTRSTFISTYLEVHRVVAQKRMLTLTRINDSLKIEISPEKRVSVTRRLVDNDSRLQFISDLLTVRTEIERAPSWPLTFPFTLKIFALILLPMLSWTGAGLVSQVIKAAL